MNSINPRFKNVFVADDDTDDCMLFEDALRELCIESKITFAKDGQQLMQLLEQTVPPAPDLIFLDLNMPRKNGFECLEEIRQSPKLKEIPVIILSTTAQPDAVNKVYQKGANYFLCKPSSFSLLKKAIEQILSIDWAENLPQPGKEEFILRPEQTA